MFVYTVSLDNLSPMKIQQLGGRKDIYHILFVSQERLNIDLLNSI